ncbi:restriction endonuclease [Shewanella sp.]|uniref:restriction endonuclease n=1 Tax=Shewanella sp. TaxID=50422 RepID=UPI003A974DC9
MSQAQWETYEEVAVYLLNQFSENFELEGFSGKETISGNRSGTSWEIDGKGFSEGNDRFVIVECRRYTTSRQSQEKIGALAYRIIDAGASGGIIVSPLGLQSGAEKVAQAENITSVKLTPESTTQEYMLEFLNNICIGIVDNINVSMSDSLSITIMDADGNIIEQRNE